MRPVAPLVFDSNCLESGELDLARKLNRAVRPAATRADRTYQMSHLENIATRQRKSLVRDTLFVALVALATVVSASTVSQAVKASAIVAHR